MWDRMDVGWVWDGCGMEVGWIRDGYGMDMGCVGCVIGK